MNKSQYSLASILYLPERNMFSGVFLIEKKQSENTSNRLWHKNYWVWWAHTGKTISVNKHIYNTYTIQRFINQKIANKYQEVDENYLLEMWPEFHEKLERQMLFEVLKNE